MVESAAWKTITKWIKNGYIIKKLQYGALIEIIDLLVFENDANDSTIVNGERYRNMLQQFFSHLLKYIKLDEL